MNNYIESEHDSFFFFFYAFSFNKERAFLREDKRVISPTNPLRQLLTNKERAWAE